MTRAPTFEADREAEFARAAKHYLIDLLREDDAGKHAALYDVAGPHARCRRFGGALSDSALRAHFLGLDRTAIVCVGAYRARRLEAVAEVFPEDAHWRSAEISCLALRGFTLEGALDLLAAAMREARGCRRFVFYQFDPRDVFTQAFTRLTDAIVEQDHLVARQP